MVRDLKKGRGWFWRDLRVKGLERALGMCKGFEVLGCLCGCRGMSYRRG